MTFKNSAVVLYLKKTRAWIWLQHQILHPDLTPKQISVSFALGLSIALNPILGVHTWIALLICVLFKRIHKPLILAATFINNPWTMVPIATLSAYFGNILMARGLHLDLAHIHWHHLDWRNFVSRQGLDEMLHRAKPILAPYLLGGAVLSILAFPIGYYVMLKVTEHLRKMHLHIPRIHMPAFYRDKLMKESSHGHALPHETGPGHAAKADRGPAEPESGRDRRR